MLRSTSKCHCRESGPNSASINLQHLIDFNTNHLALVIFDKQLECCFSGLLLEFLLGTMQDA